jgi:hypothetical protein
LPYVRTGVIAAVKRLSPGEILTMSARLYAVGTLDMPAAVRADFARAVRYLDGDSRMRGIVRQAEHADRPLHLRINHHGNDSYDPSTDTIAWDPRSALATSEGGRQSPALGLGHELDHATVPAAVRERGEARYDPVYDNAEERRVIRGSEAHAARSLGEDVRYDHAGRLYTVDSPTLRRVA